MELFGEAAADEVAEVGEFGAEEGERAGLRYGRDGLVDGDAVEEREGRLAAGGPDGEEGEDFRGAGGGEGEALRLPAGEAVVGVAEGFGVDVLVAEADHELLGGGTVEALLLGAGEVEGDGDGSTLGEAGDGLGEGDLLEGTVHTDEVSAVGAVDEAIRVPLPGAQSWRLP